MCQLFFCLFRFLNKNSKKELEKKYKAKGSLFLCTYNATLLHCICASKKIILPHSHFFFKLKKKLLHWANKMFLHHGSRIDQIYLAPLLQGQIMLHCNKNCNVPLSPTLLQANVLRQEYFHSSLDVQVRCYDFFFWNVNRSKEWINVIENLLTWIVIRLTCLVVSARKILIQIIFC